MRAAQSELQLALDRLGDTPSADALRDAVVALRLAWVELVTTTEGPRDRPVLSSASESFGSLIDELSRRLDPIPDTQLDPLKERVALYRFMHDKLRTHGVAEVMGLLDAFREQIERGLSITQALAAL